MEIKLQELYKKEISRFVNLAEEGKYEKCSEISNFLAYSALAFQSKILLFLAEFLIFLYDNMTYVDLTDADGKKKAKEVNKEIVKFLNELKIIDISIDKNKEKIIDLMIDIRYAVSKFQVDVGTIDTSFILK